MNDTHRNAAPSVAVVGLGYVGLPLAEAFSRHTLVVGVDTNATKVDELQRTLIAPNLTVTTDFAAIAPADFVILAVPTPVTKFKEPDLSHVRGAAQSVGEHLRKGMTVIL
ncbi:MAG: nucleotide sugar dehydrogenase, partial [Dehalococcoidia bacterium]